MLEYSRVTKKSSWSITPATLSRVMPNTVSDIVNNSTVKIFLYITVVMSGILNN